MGIHGERVAEFIDLPPLAALVGPIFDRLLGAVADQFAGGDGAGGCTRRGDSGCRRTVHGGASGPVEVTAMSESLDGAPQRDMGAITVAAVAAQHGHLHDSVLGGVRFNAAYAGALLTAVNATGFCLSSFPPRRRPCQRGRPPPRPQPRGRAAPHPRPSQPACAPQCSHPRR